MLGVGVAIWTRALGLLWMSLCALAALGHRPLREPVTWRTRRARGEPTPPSRPLGVGASVTEGTLREGSHDRGRWASLDARALLEALPGPTLLLDGAGRVRLANGAASEMLEAPPEGLEGRDLADVLRCLGDDPEGSPLVDVARRFPFSTTLACKDGYTLELTGAPIEGREPGTLLTLRRAHGTLAAPGPTDEREDMLLLVSHELRSPLAFVATAAELLIDGDLDDDVRRQVLGEVHAESNRLAALLEHLLDVQRLRSGALAADAEPVRPAEVVAAVVRSLRSQHPGRDVRIEIAPDVGPLRGDRVRCEVVLRNLLDNAIKYAPSAEPITVTAERADRYVRIAVRDRGPGIAPDQLGALFGRFRRVSSTPGGPAYGYGLGLYIARTLVEAQGGRIGVESREGEGALFWFALPQAHEEMGDVQR